MNSSSEPSPLLPPDSSPGAQRGVILRLEKDSMPRKLPERAQKSPTPVTWRGRLVRVDHGLRIRAPPRDDPDSDNHAPGRVWRWPTAR